MKVRCATTVLYCVLAYLEGVGYFHQHSIIIIVCMIAITPAFIQISEKKEENSGYYD